MKTGVCLPGGGAAGAAQAGILKALQPYRQHITNISCASVGSLNGCMFVQNRTADMEHLWKTIRRRDIYGYWKVVVPFSSSYFSTGPLRRLVHQEVSVAKLATSHITLHVSATPWPGGRAYVANPRSDPARFHDWVMASCAIPVAFPPVKIGNTFYVDGGVSDNSPLDPLIHAGCERIIVCHCRPEAQDNPRVTPPSRGGVIAGMVGLFMKSTQDWDSRWMDRVNYHVRNGTARPGEREIERIDIYPPAEADIGTLEFNRKKAARAFDVSYDAARKQLSHLNLGTTTN